MSGEACGALLKNNSSMGCFHCCRWLNHSYNRVFVESIFSLEQFPDEVLPQNCNVFVYVAYICMTVRNSQDDGAWKTGIVELECCIFVGLWKSTLFHRKMSELDLIDFNVFQAFYFYNLFFFLK